MRQPCVGAWQTALHPDDFSRAEQELQDAVAGKKPFETEFRVVWTDGTIRHIKAVAKLFRDGDGTPWRMLGTNWDITAAKLAEALTEAQKNVLKLIACGVPLKESLTALALAIEQRAPPYLCSILLLGKDGQHLKHEAAPSLPSLPPAYCDAIDGVAIGPEVGSCGTAAFLREEVIAEDIGTDYRWTRWRDFTLSHNLQACWSVPINRWCGPGSGDLRRV